MPSITHNIDAYVEPSGLPAPVYPSLVAGAADLLVHKNLFSNVAIPTLAASMAPGDTSFSLAPGTGAAFPTSYFAASVDQEIILVLERDTDVCIVATRGFEGTTPAAHNAGAPVNAFVTAKSHNQLASEIIAIEKTLGANLANSVNIANAEIPAGSTPGTSFTLQHIPKLLLLVWNGVVQGPGVDFTLVGTSLSMVNTVQPGDSFFAWYLY